MKKQVVHASIYSRIIAFYIDIFLYNVIIVPIINLLSLNPNTTEHLSGLKLELLSKSEILFLIFNPIVHFFALFCYFCFFWRKKGATPGKMLMKIKILSQVEHSTPTIKQCIKRFFFYALALFSILKQVLPFGKVKNFQWLHDRFAQTIVIKS